MKLEQLSKVKMVPIDEADNRAAIQRELEILTKLRHRSIVHLYGTVDNDDEDELWAVLQYCELGSLERILRVFNDDGDASSSSSSAVALLEAMGAAVSDDDGGNRTPAAQQRLSKLLGGPLPGVGAAFFRIAKDVVRGVMYLHEKSIAHSDLKPGNILLDAHGSACVADFGVARVVRTTVGGGGGRSTAGGGPKGTVGYMAPEVGNGERASKASDIFSLGMLLNELLTGVVPYAHLDNDMAVALAVQRGERPDLPDTSYGSGGGGGGGGDSTESLAELIGSMWQAAPPKRPEAVDVYASLVDAAAKHGPDAVRVIFFLILDFAFISSRFL